MNKQVLKNCAVILQGFFLFACSPKTETIKPKTFPPILVDALVASAKPVSNTLEVNGTVVANEYVELHPEASGRLTYLNVEEGKLIKKGTLIAIINNADLQAQLDKSKVALELAEKTEQRDKQLLAVNGLNQSDYDAALNVVNGFKADIEYNKALLDKTILKAPFDGYIGLRQVSVGAYVTPSTLIATLSQLDKIKIDFTIPEDYSSAVKIGGIVDVDMDENGKTRKARVIAIEPQVNLSTRNMTIRAILENSKANPGSFVKVILHSGLNQSAIMIPTNALIPDDKNSQVVLVKDGKANFSNVKTGIRFSNNVEITAGVNPGDTVVVTGVLFARPKAPLQVRHVRTLEEFAALNNNEAAK
ncbi:MAG TPA: efflux RND transporter periplasmic adaptor subunit [Puia sp.]|jgi:membrane fusion protein (multidrug efflux system)